MTIIKSASVKVMRSYDYCHFETSMSLENDSGIVPAEIDLARKDCQRLCDKAVAQYQKAKESAAKRTDNGYAMKNFESDCLRIKAKAEHDRTLKEIGMLKQYENERWQDQFDSRYDYEDDENDRY